ncbi:neuromedin-U receptor 2-like [Elysia marginata]|uniref:Neuromedin-U receptor 2-like n=1 Tax=Elysia marginata TaxID=1093978 RepID=A0AAV4IHV1_9GAST|nr:neuromedin-U receptor 2-like [Elysia marginata]
MLVLQSQENIDYIRQKCTQARITRHCFAITSFAVGVPANTLALVALMTLRPRSIGLFYIALLTASDFAAVVLRFVDYLMVEHAVYTPLLLCGFRGTLVNFFPCYANWLLVVIVFERYYTLRFPLHKNAHFTFSRARLLVAGLGLVLFLYNLPRTFMAGQTQGGYCIAIENFIYEVMSDIDQVLLFYGPLVLIFLLVGLIAHALLQAQEARERMFASHSLQARDDKRLSTAIEGNNSRSRQGSEAPLNEHTSRMLRQQRKNERSLTIMMFCAAIFFVVMTCPLIVMMHVRPDPMVGVAELNFKFNITWARGLNMLTHAANFFLYFMTCRRMRNHLCKILRLGNLQTLCGCVGNDSVQSAETEMTNSRLEHHANGQ